MNDERIQRELHAALVSYYEQANPDDEDNNSSLARPAIARWGDMLVTMGLAVIAEQLQEFERKTRSMFRLNETAGNDAIMNMGWKFLLCHRTLVRAFGEHGIARLGQTLGYTDEDCIALAAFLLANSEFVRPKSVPTLKSAFQRVDGTGCKLALAFALNRHGEKEPFRSLARHYLVSDEGIRRFKELFSDSHSEMSQSQIEDVVMQEIAVPGSSGYVPAYISERFSPGVFRLVALDIATNGQVYKQHSNWKRKQY